MIGRNWLDELAHLAHAEADRRWHDTLTIESEVLALVEEVGELCRAVVKRREGTRGTTEEWTSNLRLEWGQAMLVLLNISALEGFKPSEAVLEAWAEFQGKPDREP
jgi:NTP pyrophosphatase (non-canonical NTP hydrolase)